MNSSFSIRMHYLLRMLLIAGLAVYIIHLNRADALHYYLAPHMQLLLLCCPVPLLFIALSMGLHGVGGRTEELCDCEHTLPDTLSKKIFVYGLFVLPLLLGGLLPDKSLGSDMAAKKGMSYTLPGQELRRKQQDGSVQGIGQAAAAGNGEAAALRSLDARFVPPDEYNVEFAELAKRLYLEPKIVVQEKIFSETIGAIDLYKHEFEGKPISITGFVYKDEQMGNGLLFAIGRFLVMCCPADATPFGIMVEAEHAPKLAKDSWVKVEGTLHVAADEGVERLEIRAAKITPTEEPETPYIYTQADALAIFDRL
ncbi:TIGR03943 family protein [Paenibacillus sp. P96]|uniref:TIGR03943 family protein n=1 Tax=Paenibacillus zeirhizosphaerae TaxID=2987519 RepID=A0ABT9FRA0_9BACL|nr:TIGR03943 family protein [Paenibacillus sp. P96]MDP4097261.1 TIGR03943 family protein [Paenibacillus sp. P96]